MFDSIARVTTSSAIETNAKRVPNKVSTAMSPNIPTPFSFFEAHHLVSPGLRGSRRIAAGSMHKARPMGGPVCREALTGLGARCAHIAAVSRRSSSIRYEGSSRDRVLRFSGSCCHFAWSLNIYVAPV